MKSRRQIVLALGAAALVSPLASSGEQAKKPYRIGFLGSESDQTQAKRLEALRSGLADLGYAEGRNIVIEVRWAEGKYDRLPSLASELVALKVNVIVTAGTKATVAAKDATTVIPIVMGSTGDPIGLGLTTNLARPSRNLTGRTNISAELGPKLLELLKEAAPQITQVAYLVNPADPPTLLPAIESAAKSLRLVLRFFESRVPAQFDGAFAGMVKARSDALVVQRDTLFEVNVPMIAELALKHQLASASTISDFAEVGGLITYGPSALDGYRRAAIFVDKLLRGARPADLPIEQPTKFELVINLKTAKALGITVPPTLLARADEVIE